MNKLSSYVLASAFCAFTVSQPALAENLDSPQLARETTKNAVTQEEIKLDYNSILFSVLWQQTSPEYVALCMQTYNRAFQVMHQAVSSGDYKMHDGRLCQEILFHDGGKLVRIYKPLAIVLDIDETVADNSALEAWTLMNKTSYQQNYWDQWCRFQGAEPKACKAVPGAVQFLKRVKKMGITPIYITNREEETRPYTLKLLQHIGLDSENLNDCLILRDKKNDIVDAEKMVSQMGISRTSPFAKNLLNNASDKAGRRKQVETKYTVLGWFGDNLYDFPVEVDSAVKDPAKIRELREEQAGVEFRKAWGNKFFILPNPIYGSWVNSAALPTDMLYKGLDDWGFGAWRASQGFKD